MQRVIESNSPMFNSHAVELTKAFHNYRHFDENIHKCLNRLGYIVKKSKKHVKCYYNNYLVVTISTTPSDAFAGNQVVRYFRRFWENYEC